MHALYYCAIWFFILFSFFGSFCSCASLSARNSSSWSICKVQLEKSSPNGQILEAGRAAVSVQQFPIRRLRSLAKETRSTAYLSWCSFFPRNVGSGSQVPRRHQRIASAFDQNENCLAGSLDVTVVAYVIVTQRSWREITMRSLAWFWRVYDVSLLQWRILLTTTKKISPVVQYVFL